MTNPTSLIKGNRFARAVMARPRLFICVLAGLVAGAALPASVASHTITRILFGWDLGASLYLVLALHMMFSSTHERMRTRALEQDEGRLLILAMVLMAAVVSLAAIVSELAVVKTMHGSERYIHVALALVTLLASWAFTHLMFALHYAHDYYASLARGGNGGLAFPGGELPDYGDFLYFASVIGTSGQTADVNFTGKTMRRTGLVHCVLSFFFNATFLALSINIASSLF